MVVISHTALQKKGWNEREIQRLEMTVNVPRPYDIHFSKIVFWSSLLVIILGNLLISLFLIPFLLILPPWLVYGIVILVGGCIGVLYRLLIRDIGHLEKKHHLLAGILVPIIAVANLIAVVLVTNRFIVEVQMQATPQNAWLTGIIFGVMIILPYLIGVIFNKR